MPLFLLTNWKWLTSAALAAIITWYAGHLSHRAAIDRIEKQQAEAIADSTRATLAMFMADADKIHEAADAYTALQAGLDTRFSDISKDFHNAVKAKPLPVDCKPDADRVRALEAAITAANTAVGQQPSPAMPKDW